MINKIISGISNVIDEEFEGSLNVYSNEVRQGLEEPCFFISCMTMKVKKYPSKRFLWQLNFIVQYIPKIDADISENYDTASRLCSCLQSIVVGGNIVNDTGIKVEFGEVVSVFVSYDISVYYAEEKEESMSDITLQQLLNSKGVI